jgi:hypothetical protein
LNESVVAGMVVLLHPCRTARLAQRRSGEPPIIGWSSSAPALKVAPPAGWTLTKRPPEEPAQVCLIGKAGAQSYFGQRSRAGHHQMTGPLQPSPHDVSVRCFSEGLFEGSREIRFASLHHGADVLGVDGAVQILINESAHARYLPGR